MKTRSWEAEPEELEALWDALRFEHYKWDIYHRSECSIYPDALVLTPAEHRRLVETAEGVWSALRSVEALVCEDAELVRAAGVPEALVDAIVASPKPSPRLTRCDFHRDPDGRWWISEFNDDVPSGVLESTGLASVLEGRFAGARFEGDLRRAIVDAFAPWPRVGMVCATAYSEDLQHVARIEDWLVAAGHHVVRASPQALGLGPNGGARLHDDEVDLVFRYFPGEWIGELPNAEVWKRAASEVPLMNPMRSLCSQSKRFYAMADAFDLPLHPTERGWLTEAIPVSRLLERVERGELLARREQLVLKGAFGRMGNTVHVGAFTPAAEWEKLVDEAYAVPLLVAVQERFLSHPVWFSGGLGHATVGVYLVDGRFAGYFSRVDRHPLIAYDSWIVPTVVELAPA